MAYAIGSAANNSGGSSGSRSNGSTNEVTYCAADPGCIEGPTMADGLQVSAVETPWDAANVGLGVAEFTFDLATGNYVGALVSGVGTVYDVTATAVPGLPGGASTLIKGYRGAKGLKASTLSTKQADIDFYNAINRSSNANNATPRTATQKIMDSIRTFSRYLDE